jgi:hypothetical protein
VYWVLPAEFATQTQPCTFPASDIVVQTPLHAVAQAPLLATPAGQAAGIVPAA